MRSARLELGGALCQMPWLLVVVVLRLSIVRTDWSNARRGGECILQSRQSAITHAVLACGVHFVRYCIGTARVCRRGDAFLGRMIRGAALWSYTRFRRSLKHLASSLLFAHFSPLLEWCKRRRRCPYRCITRKQNLRVDIYRLDFSIGNPMAPKCLNRVTGWTLLSWGREQAAALLGFLYFCSARGAPPRCTWWTRQGRRSSIACGMGCAIRPRCLRETSESTGATKPCLKIANNYVEGVVCVGHRPVMDWF